MIALTIAGSDSGGGAGIQADLKTFSALGVYGASVITALTAQNTLGVTAVMGVPADFVRAQLDAVLDDLDVRAIKIGMVSEIPVIETLARRLDGIGIPVVLDPVMVAASGHRLVPEAAVAALRGTLFPIATLVTPNVPEAAVLLGTAPAETVEAMEEQAAALADGGPAVLLKGGHLEGADSVDVLRIGATTERLSAGRIATRHTHGTGCTLSSAIAAHLARGADLADAVARGKAYVTAAIAAADTLAVGRGHGPVHHFHALWPTLA